MECPSSRLMSLLIAVLVTALAIPAVGQEADNSGAGFAFTADEVQQLETTLMTEIDSNRSRQCIRPNLRKEEPLPGPADVAILRLLATHGDFDDCMDLLGNDNEVTEWQINPRGDPPPMASLAVLLCRPVTEAISQAVRHQDACSPYLVGRAVPEMLTFARLGRTARAASVVARDMARAGDRAGALALLVDELRFAQDVARGHGAPLVARMVAASTAELAIRLGLMPLLESGDLSERELTQLANDLDRLLESDPSGPDLLDAERQWSGLQTVLPHLKSVGWIPPGGADPLARDESGKVLNQPSCGHACWSRQWLVTNAVYRAMADACAGAPPYSCAERLDRLTSNAAAALRLNEDEAARTCKEVAADQPSKSRDELVARQLVCFDQWGWSDRGYRQTLQSRYYLNAARLHVSVLLYRLRNGRCPAAEDVNPGAEAGRAATSPDSTLPAVVQDSPDLWLACPPGNYLSRWSEPYRFACIDGDLPVAR